MKIALLLVRKKNLKIGFLVVINLKNIVEKYITHVIFALKDRLGIIIIEIINALDSTEFKLCIQIAHHKYIIRNTNTKNSFVRI